MLFLLALTFADGVIPVYGESTRQEQNKWTWLGAWRVEQ